MDATNGFETELTRHPDDPNHVPWECPEPKNHVLCDLIHSVTFLEEERKGITVAWVTVAHEGMGYSACGIARKGPGEPHDRRVGRKVAIYDALEQIFRKGFTG